MLAETIRGKNTYLETGDITVLPRRKQRRGCLNGRVYLTISKGNNYNLTNNSTYT